MPEDSDNNEPMDTYYEIYKVVVPHTAPPSQQQKKEIIKVDAVAAPDGDGATLDALSFVFVPALEEATSLGARASDVVARLFADAMATQLTRSAKKSKRQTITSPTLPDGLTARSFAMSFMPRVIFALQSPQPAVDIARRILSHSIHFYLQHVVDEIFSEKVELQCGVWVEAMQQAAQRAWGSEAPPKRDLLSASKMRASGEVLLDGRKTVTKEHAEKALSSLLLMRSGSGSYGLEVIHRLPKKPFKMKRKLIIPGIGTSASSYLEADGGVVATAPMLSVRQRALSYAQQLTPPGSPPRTLSPSRARSSPFAQSAIESSDDNSRSPARPKPTSLELQPREEYEESKEAATTAPPSPHAEAKNEVAAPHVTFTRSSSDMPHFSQGQSMAEPPAASSTPRKDIADFCISCKVLQDKVAALTAKLEEERRATSRLRETHDSNVAAVQSQVNIHKREISALKAELAAAEKASEEAVARVEKKYENSITYLQERITGCTCDLQSVTAERNALQERLGRELSESAGALVTTTVNFESEMSELRWRLRNHDKIVKEKEEAIDAAEQKARKVEVDLCMYVKRATAAEAQACQQKETIAHLNARLSEIEHTASSLQQAMDGIHDLSCKWRLEAMALVQATSHELHQQFLRLNAELIFAIQDQKRTLVEASSHNEAILAELHTKEADLAGREKDLAAREAQLEQALADSESTTLSERKRRLQALLQLESQLAVRERAVSALEKSTQPLGRLTKENEGLREQVKSLLVQLVEARACIVAGIDNAPPGSMD